MLTLGLTATVWVLAILFIFVSLFMMLVVLIQKPKGGGLSGAFGGGGGSAQAVLGSKAGDFFTKLTIVLFVAFLALAMGLTWAVSPEDPDASGEVTPVSTTGSSEDPGDLIEEALPVLPGEGAVTEEAPTQTPADGAADESPAPPTTSDP